LNNRYLYIVTVVIWLREILMYPVRKFMLNLTHFYVSQTVHSNYYVNLTLDEYVRK